MKTERKEQQVLPTKNIPQHPLLRYAIAQMIFIRLPDIEHTARDWIYFKDPLFDAADEIIERFIDTRRPIDEFVVKGNDNDARDNRDRPTRTRKEEVRHLPTDNSEPRQSNE